MRSSNTPAPAPTTDVGMMTIQVRLGVPFVLNSHCVAETSQLISQARPLLRQASGTSDFSCVHLLTHLIRIGILEENHVDLRRTHHQNATENHSSQKRSLCQRENDSENAILHKSLDQAVRDGEGPSKKLKKLMDDFDDEMSCPM